MKDPITLTEAEAAAWWVLSQFINPIDCSEWQEWMEDGKQHGGAIPLNTNDWLNKIINGDLVEVDGKMARPSPHYLSKSKFMQHMRGQTKLYYRTRHQAHPRTGYGSWDDAHKKLPFNYKLFGINGKASIDKDSNLLLVGWDIDAHNGEKDVEKVRDYLLKKHFRGCYAEMSTNGNGCHIYQKVSYDPKMKRSHSDSLMFIYDTLRAFHGLLESELTSKGFDAPLDRPCGLPTIFSFDPDYKGKEPTDYRLKVLKRPQCIKIPFRKNCSLENVLSFYESPVTPFDQMLSVVQEHDWQRLMKDVEGKDTSVYLPDSLIPNPEGQERKVVEESIALLCVPPRSYTLSEVASSVSAYDDSFIRRWEFSKGWCAIKGQVGTAQQMMSDYNAMGLASGRRDSNPETQLLEFQNIHKYLKKHFDPSKRSGLSMTGYEVDRVTFEAMMQQKLSQMPPYTFQKGRGDVRTVNPKKAAAVWWSMHRVSGGRQTISFGFNHAKKILKEIGMGAGRNEISVVWQMIEDAGLAVRTGSYSAGGFAQRWEILRQQPTLTKN